MALATVKRWSETDRFCGVNPTYPASHLSILLNLTPHDFTRRPLQEQRLIIILLPPALDLQQCVEIGGKLHHGKLICTFLANMSEEVSFKTANLTRFLSILLIGRIIVCWIILNWLCFSNMLDQVLNRHCIM